MKHKIFSLLRLIISVGLSLPSIEPVLGRELTPVAFNFNKKDYGWNSQNWAVACCTDGTMCFGNGNGLLCYDGLSWELFSLPGGKTARSLLCKGDVVYVGSFEEFGYFKRGCTGDFEYTSLSSSLSGFEFHNEDFWTILDFGDEIIFHSFTALFFYNLHSEQIRIVKPNGFIENLAMDCKGRLLSSYAGLSLINPDSGELYPVRNLPFSSRMIAILPYGESASLIVTLSDGLYLMEGEDIRHFDTAADSLLCRASLNRAGVDSDGNFVLGSTIDGCFCVSASGRLLWHVNSSNALSDNTILGIGSDKESNIWLAMDSGIAMISGGKRPCYISSFIPSVGAIYSVCYDAPFLYIGSNQGLYSCRYDNARAVLGEVYKYPDVKGNVWYIDSYDGQIICGTNGPTWELAGGRALRIPSENVGGTCMARGVIAGKEVLVQGTYTEICIWLRHNGKWSYSHRIDNFIQPFESIAIDNRGTVWAAHSEGGLYKIQLTGSLKEIASMEYFPGLSDDNLTRISVFNLFGRIVFSDGTLFYTYDDLTSKIVSYSSLNRSVGRFSAAKKISSVGDGERLWLICDDEAGLFRFKPDGSGAVLQYTLPLALFQGLTVDRRSEIKPVGDSVFVATLSNSLAFVSPFGADSPVGDLPPLRLRKMEISDAEKNTVVKADISSGSFDLPYKYRLMHLTLSCPRYSVPREVNFSYILKGRDKVWTRLGSNPQIDLSFVPEGRYALEVRAEGLGGEVLGSLEIPFRIRPPWYRSVPALICYALVVLLFLSLLISIPIRRIREQRKDIERQRLENELASQSSALALSAMNMSQKNELLRQIKSELEAQKKSLGDAWPNRYYRQIISSIDKFTSSDEDWEMFEKNFDLIHKDFFKKLRNLYPSLTASDLRFCAYLCMNLSSKEIASMMNISLKGVEAARRRIRKKLRLPSKQNLSEFLMGI